MPKPPPPSQAAPALGTKRGRKPKSAADKRTHLVACRLTDGELEQLDATRGLLTRGEGLRQLALARRLPAGIPEINRQAYGELARASANLNQLSRRANSAGQLDISALTCALGTFRLALLGVTPATLDAADEEEEEEKNEKSNARGTNGAAGLGPASA